MVARSIDIGYGNVKYCSSHEGVLSCKSFPSVVSMSKRGSFGGGMLAGKDTRVVTVGESTYYVGPDAALMLEHGDGRVLTSDYTEKGHYLALARGALAYMGDRSIDVLVTGLPVNLYHQYKDKLSSSLAGIHPCGDGLDVSVGKVHVLPQPVGGFLHFAAAGGVDVKGTHSLVIDVGFYSVDWLVCKELKTIDPRCGSVDMGMSRLLGQLAEEVSRSFGEDFKDINRLDEALNSGRQLEWYGKKIGLDTMLKKVSSLGDAACESIANGIGQFNDISNVIVVGGGARFYRESIERMCRKNPVHWLEDGMFANVKGFQVAAERWARNG